MRKYARKDVCDKKQYSKFSLKIKIDSNTFC